MAELRAVVALYQELSKEWAKGANRDLDKVTCFACLNTFFSIFVLQAMLDFLLLHLVRTQRVFPVEVGRDFVIFKTLKTRPLCMLASSLFTEDVRDIVKT